MCRGELQVNVKGGVSWREGFWGGLMGQVRRARDALSIDGHTEHPCALAGLRIVPADKGLIQHILSPRENSGNRRRWPSPPYSPLLPSSAPARPPFRSPSPSLWPVTWQWPCIKGNHRTMQGASQEFAEFFFVFFLKRNFTWHGLLSYPGQTISAAAEASNQRENARAQPKQSYTTVTHCTAWLSTNSEKKKL